MHNEPKTTHAEVASDARVSRWLADTGLLDARLQAVVLRVREAVLALSPDITEEVKYGGLLFSSVRPFCGVFAYSSHVSLEFGRGAQLLDEMGLLEGCGKLRRHLKLRTLDDLQSLRVNHYLSLAHKAVKLS